ncbi:MAG: ferredoxin [Bacteroidota bacterium]
MSIKKVWIENNCTACSLCEDFCPNVFKIEKVASVIYGVDLSKYEEDIKDAASNCPVDIIKYLEN